MPDLADAARPEDRPSTHPVSPTGASQAPVDRVRRAIQGDPPPVDLAAPILERDVRELTRRCAAVRARGGAYASVTTSPEVRRLLLGLEAGATLSGQVH